MALPVAVVVGFALAASALFGWTVSAFAIGVGIGLSVYLVRRVDSAHNAHRHQHYAGSARSRSGDQGPERERDALH